MERLRKRFNIAGTCFPNKHYMVDLTERLNEIKVLIDNGDYFVINRARQYGKTTTLRALKEYLQPDYSVVSMSFQRMSATVFQNEYTFVSAFAEAFYKKIQQEITTFTFTVEQLTDLAKIGSQVTGQYDLMALFDCLGKLCQISPKKMILIIDEVDQAANNQVFLDFLGQLRDMYLEREDVATFHSVILAGVYDIKNLKQKIRPDDTHKYNSPWNIAVPFDVDMSFSIEDIADMLACYEEEHLCGMNILEIATAIYEYTSGYPFLVSYLCKTLDEDKGQWNLQILQMVVKEMLQGTNTLFDDIIKNLEHYPGFRQLVEGILLQGMEFSFVLANPDISMGAMFGILKNVNGRVQISNRIFEMYIYEYMISVNRTQNIRFGSYTDKGQYIHEGKLDMEHVIRRFSAFLKAKYRKEDGDFIEQQGRLLFLCFLRPIINGTGHYAVEAETRQNARMDIQVFYGSEEFIVELKIWHGLKYEEKGYDQLTDYLDAREVEKGYVISFCRNQKKPLEDRKFVHNGHVICETVVMY